MINSTPVDLVGGVVWSVGGRVWGGGGGGGGGGGRGGGACSQATTIHDSGQEFVRLQFVTLAAAILTVLAYRSSSDSTAG